MKGLVLAGGYGTRLRPLTFSGNKHMLPIANQPILFYSLRNLARAGIRDVGVVLGPLHEGIREAIGDGKEFGLRVEYIVQGDPKGLAHAVLCAREFLGDDPFVMYLGDNLLQSGVEPFLARYESDRPDAVVGATPVTHPEQYGIVEIQESGIASIEEKPSRPKSNLALIGVYLFTPAIHQVVAKLAPSRRGELEITEAIWGLVTAGRHVSVLQVDGWWKDTGHPGDLLDANELVLRSLPADAFVIQGKVEPGAIIEGNVGIGLDSIVEPGAHIVGPTVIGSRARIGRGSLVGPYCAVGDRVLLDRTQVRRSIIMEGTRIVGMSIANSLVGRNVDVHAERPPERETILTLGDSSRVSF